MSIYTAGGRVIVSGGRPYLRRVNAAPPEGPMALFFPPTGQPGQPTQFVDSSVAGDAALVSWLWDFGDPATGADNTSTLQNPSHVYSAEGTFTVTLTVSDANGLSDTYQTSVVVSDLVSQIDAISAAGAGEGRSYRSGGLGYQEDLTSISVADLISTQRTGGPTTTNGTWPQQGAVPTTGSDASAYYRENHLRAYTLKVAAAYRYGDHDPSAQDDPAARLAVWRALKFFRDNFNLDYFDRGTWTPYGWWTMEALGWVLNIMLPAYLANPSELVDGVTIEQIVRDIFDEVAGMDNNFTRDGTLSRQEQNLTGSVDNNTGANGISRAAKMTLVAMFAARVTLDVSYLQELRQTVIDLFSPVFGASYYDFLDDWQDWVGLTPHQGWAAHNGAGSQAHLFRYGYTTIGAFDDYFLYTTGTFLEMDASVMQYLVDMVVEMSAHSPRQFCTGMSFGRSTNNWNFPGRPGAVRTRLESIILRAPFTPAQTATVEGIIGYLFRRVNVPPYRQVKWKFSVGIMSMITPTSMIHMNYTRGNLGSEQNAAVASREQQPGDYHQNWVIDYVQIQNATSLPEGDTARNFNQVRDLVFSGDYPWHGPEGAVEQMTIADMISRSNTTDGINRNDDMCGTVFDDGDDGMYMIGGQWKDRVLAYSKVNCWTTNAAINMRGAPLISDDACAVVEMQNSITRRTAPLANIGKSTHMHFRDPVIYNMGGGEVTVSPGASSSATFAGVTNGWYFQELVPTTGSAWGRGEARIFVGTYDIGFDVVGSRFRVFADLGANPSNASAVVIALTDVTLADVRQIVGNLGTYFQITNTPQIQGVRYVPQNVGMYNIWQPNVVGGVPQTVGNLDGVNTVASSESAAVICKQDGGDWRVSIGRNRWTDDERTPASGGVLRGTELYFPNKTGPQFVEWASFNISVHRDRNNPQGERKQPGVYYSGGASPITLI